MNLWRVEREWDGETCAVLGGGASMSAAVAESVRGRCRVIAVNNQGVSCVNGSGKVQPALAPWADVLYAADRMWWHHNRGAAEQFAGIKATVMPNGYNDFVPLFDGLRVLGNGGADGFDDRPDHVRTGWNSGYQALHLAAHFGAKRVLLLGFDMHAAAGEHWFGDHRWRKGYKSRYPLFARAFTDGAPEFAKRGVDVVNCTPGSALGCFRQASVEEGLGDGVQQVREGAPRFTGTCAQSSRGARAGSG